MQVPNVGSLGYDPFLDGTLSISFLEFPKKTTLIALLA